MEKCGSIENMRDIKPALAYGMTVEIGQRLVESSKERRKDFKIVAYGR